MWNLVSLWKVSINVWSLINAITWWELLNSSAYTCHIFHELYYSGFTKLKKFNVQRLIFFIQNSFHLYSLVYPVHFRSPKYFWAPILSIITICPYSNTGNNRLFCINDQSIIYIPCWSLQTVTRPLRIGKQLPVFAPVQEGRGRKSATVTTQNSPEPLHNTKRCIIIASQLHILLCLHQ